MKPQKRSRKLGHSFRTACWLPVPCCPVIVRCCSATTPPVNHAANQGARRSTDTLRRARAPRSDVAIGLNVTHWPGGGVAEA